MTGRVSLDDGALNEENARLSAENRRLRKELEEARATIESNAAEFLRRQGPDQVLVIEKEHICDHEATISKLKEFSEGQARQISGLEVALGNERTKVDCQAKVIVSQALELEKLKRGKR